MNVIVAFVLTDSLVTYLVSSLVSSLANSLVSSFAIVCVIGLARFLVRYGQFCLSSGLLSCDLSCILFVIPLIEFSSELWILFL